MRPRTSALSCGAATCGSRSRVSAPKERHSSRCPSPQSSRSRWSSCSSAPGNAVDFAGSPYRQFFHSAALAVHGLECRSWTLSPPRGSIRAEMADELVLIVDDNAKNLKLARDVLRHDGFRTLEAATAREAVSLATEQLPDLVLMDIRLPDMDGTDALRLLKEDERTAPIPVVALTSMDPDQEQFTADGFDGCLTKPISVTDFGHQIRAWLR